MFGLHEHPKQPSLEYYSTNNVLLKIFMTSVVILICNCEEILGLKLKEIDMQKIFRIVNGIVGFSPNSQSTLLLVQVVTAMGRTWHPEHFVCTHCQEEIGSRNFFEREGLPYCETDYHNLFSPRCHYCNGPILDVSPCCVHMCSFLFVDYSHPTKHVVVSFQKVVTALDRTWHPEHFFCAQCGSFFGPEGTEIYFWSYMYST